MRSIPTGIYVLLILSLLMSAFLSRAKSRTHSDRSFKAYWIMFEEFISMTLVIVMSSAAVVQVVVRYFLSDFFVVGWTEELALMAQIWLTFWAGAAVTRMQDHISLTVAYDYMPEPLQRACLIIGDLIGIGLLGFIAWLGYRDAQFLDIVFTVSLGMPVSYFAFAVPAGFALFVIHCIIHLVDHIRSPHIAPLTHLPEEEHAI